jgi:hypothetical protein
MIFTIRSDFTTGVGATDARPAAARPFPYQFATLSVPFFSN